MKFGTRFARLKIRVFFGGKREILFERNVFTKPDQFAVTAVFWEHSEPPAGGAENENKIVKSTQVGKKIERGPPV